jgi:hypothetical protein
MIFDEEKVLKAMIDEGYQEEMAKEIIKSYDKWDIRIQEALNQWINDKTIKHIEVEGVDIEYIMKKKRCIVDPFVKTIFLNN